MVENVEKAPEVGKDNNESAITAEDVGRKDFADFNDADKTAKAGDADALAAFDGDNGFHLVDEGEKQAPPKELPDTKPPKGIEELEIVPGSEREKELDLRGAKADLNPDGTLKSLEIIDNQASVQFEFNENGIRRITDYEGTKVVTEFSRDGKPQFATKFAPGQTHGENVPVSENDSIHIVENPHDIFVLSNDSSGDTTIRLGRDGSVVERIIKMEGAMVETSYGEDGKLASDTLTQFSENGDINFRFTENELGTTEEFFDENGKWEKSVFKGDGVVKTTTEREDGSRVEVAEKEDGTAEIAVLSPDGTRYLGKVEPGKNTLTTIHTDGTKMITTETAGHTTHTMRDTNGNWIQVRRDKETGVSIITRGNEDGAYGKPTVQYEI